MDNNHHFFESQLAATLEQFQQLFHVWLAATNDLIECERELANDYACDVRKERVDGAYAHMKQAKAAWLEARHADTHYKQSLLVTNSKPTHPSSVAATHSYDDTNHFDDYNGIRPTEYR